ncbi:MAG: hypothetical protein AB1744_00645 [Candidatus Zixiibacteriota bacterium]
MRMTLAKQLIRCPLCKEPIAAGASRCKHCHADLSQVTPTREKWLVKLDTFRNGFLAGVLFTLILVLLSYLHCNSGA